jgi:hypothetical protein
MRSKYTGKTGFPVVFEVDRIHRFKNLKSQINQLFATLPKDDSERF